jgi:hypothetical protein
MVFTRGMHASKLTSIFTHPPDVTPVDSLHASATQLEALSHSVQAVREFSRCGEGFAATGFTFAVTVAGGVVGSCDHALTLTSRRGHNQSRVPSLDRPLETGVGGTMNPSDSRPARRHFTFGL